MQITRCESVNQILSWFPIVKEEEILAVYQAALPSNTKKNSQLALAVSLFTNTIFLVLDVKLSTKTGTKLLFYNSRLEQLRQSNSSVIV